MALCGKKEGGLMDVIRCDEPSYLIWKWRPAGTDANTTNKENAIRWSSSLRVKDGEAAVFVYKQKDGAMQDFIEGPFGETIFYRSADRKPDIQFYRYQTGALYHRYRHIASGVCACRVWDLPGAQVTGKPESAGQTYTGPVW
jgi:hypothetical protein